MEYWDRDHVFSGNPLLVREVTRRNYTTGKLSVCQSEDLRQA